MERALALFADYEARVDLDAPQETIDALYDPYLRARREAVDVATSVNWRASEARALP